MGKLQWMKAESSDGVRSVFSRLVKLQLGMFSSQVLQDSPKDYTRPSKKSCLSYFPPFLFSHPECKMGH